MTIIRSAAASFFLISSILGTSFPAHAALDDFLLRLKSCKAIEATIARGRCYDEATRDYDIDTLNLAPIENEQGKWKVSAEKSQIDDSTNIFARLNGDDYISIQGSNHSRPVIVARCQEGKSQGYIVWDTPLGEKEAPVRIRWGKDPALAEIWTLSSDTQATFIPDIAAFIKKMNDYENIFIEVSPARSDPLSSTFDLRGSAVALKPLMEACKME